MREWCESCERAVRESRVRVANTSVPAPLSASSYLFLSSLELSDTNVYDY